MNESYVMDGYSLLYYMRLNGGPYLCHPSTSHRAQNRSEFVELARDMSSGTRSHSCAPTRDQRT